MKSLSKSRFSGIFAIAVISCGMTQAASIFNFEGDSVGTATQFTDTSNGLSATFLSPGDPGGFVIQPTIFQALSGNVLGDPGPSGAQGIPLEIDFSSNVTALSLVFATADFGPPSLLTLTAFLGSAQVGNISSTGILPVGFTFPEGEIAYSGTAFNRVVISSVAPDLAIDNLAAVAAPEPCSLLLFAVGLIGFGFIRWNARALKSVIAALSALGAVALFAVSARAIVPVFPLPATSASTVPSNGDVNPYGVAYVPAGVLTDGLLQKGDVLVSNFNNSQNLQGTGTTIVRISQTGVTSTFYQGNRGLGLTGALGILSNGIVIVGNLPTADGTSATVQAGSLLVIDRKGRLLGAVANNAILNGPWGMAIHELGNGTAQLFVSNVLAGTITRFNATYDAAGESLTIAQSVTVGSGFTHRTDPAALVLGPSGLAYDAAHDTLYVASSSDNAVYALAGVGAASASLSKTIIYQDPVHLHGPLDLVLAPTGHLLVANSDGSNVDPNQPSELVEFTTAGAFVSQFSVDPNNGGAFGLNLFNVGWGTVRVAAVDDNANTLKLWTTVLQ
jgi:hypothetical protein